MSRTPNGLTQSKIAGLGAAGAQSVLLRILRHSLDARPMLQRPDSGVVLYGNGSPLGEHANRHSSGIVSGSVNEIEECIPHRSLSAHWQKARESHQSTQRMGLSARNGSGSPADLVSFVHG